jgi:hypothetical protein
VLRVIDQPDSLRVLVQRSKTQVEKSREISAGLQTATERTLRRVKETERRIVESDTLIDDYRSSFFCELVNRGSSQPAS